MSLLLLALGGGAVYWLGTWIQYRTENIVSHDAVVCGVVSHVGARLEGQLVEVLVEPGAHVAKGDILARLESSHLQAGARQARANLALCEQEYTIAKLSLEFERQRRKLQLDHDAADLRVSLAEIEAAAGHAERWQGEWKRIKELHASKVLTQHDRDLAAAKLTAAVAAKDAAEARQTAAETRQLLTRLEHEALSIQEAKVELLATKVEAAAAAVAYAEAELAATEIVAPGDGWVVERGCEPGASLKIGQSIVSLWLDRGLWVEAWVDESVLADFKLGSPADITLTAYPGEVFQGHLASIGTLADHELLGRTSPKPTVFSDPQRVRVRIDLPSTGRRVMPGLSAAVGIRNQKERWSRYLSAFWSNTKEE